MNQDKMVSRFITRNDPKREKFVFNLPSRSHWYSRPYEYAWAAEFAKSDDIALDAGCGISHPFKFYLAEHCHQVHACDIDPRILSPDEIMRAIAEDFGQDEAKEFSRELIYRVRFANCSITSLPYKDAYFDKIYCISVLEHLDDIYNKKPLMLYLRSIINKFLSHDIYLCLKDFKRVLKKKGLIILTFDYPRINLDYFRRIIPKLGLAFAADVSFELPPSALYSEEHSLYCYRAVLRLSEWEDATK